MPDTFSVGIVTGLAAETMVLRRGLAAAGASDSDIMVACAGADTARAAKAASALLERGARALVSFGIAGGLDPALVPGDLLLPEAVVTPAGDALGTDGAWRRRLHALAAAQGLSPAGQRMAGSDRAVRSSAAKRALHQASGAVAVDMESHALAALARDRQVPFLVVRAVADPAQRPLPRAVRGSIRPDGRPRKAFVAARLALMPWEIGAVNRLRRDAALALIELEALARAAAPALTRYDGAG